MARIKTVERDPGWGWIVRHPVTGQFVYDKDWRWSSRSVARSVVNELRATPTEKDA